MINKKAQSRNDQAIWGYLLLFCIAILLLYMLSKFLLILGIILFILGFGLLIFGFHEDEEQLIFIGIILLVVGLVAFILGFAGVNFFENNLVGSDLLKTSQSVVNATGEAYGAIQDAKTVVSRAQTDAISQVTNSLENTRGS